MHIQVPSPSYCERAAMNRDAQESLGASGEPWSGRSRVGVSSNFSFGEASRLTSVVHARVHSHQQWVRMPFPMSSPVLAVTGFLDKRKPL